MFVANTVEAWGNADMWRVSAVIDDGLPKNVQSQSHSVFSGLTRSLFFIGTLRVIIYLGFRVPNIQSSESVSTGRPKKPFIALSVPEDAEVISSETETTALDKSIISPDICFTELPRQDGTAFG